jgi:hypothetical protein
MQFPWMTDVVRGALELLVTDGNIFHSREENTRARGHRFDTPPIGNFGRQMLRQKSKLNGKVASP